MIFVVAGAKPYDGRYQLDLEQELTTREWGWIKRLAGYLPMAVTDETFGDPELACVLTVIAMRRSGRIQPVEVPGVFEWLADAPFGSAITVEGEPEDEEDEPERPQMAGPSGNGSTSGGGSLTSSETPAATPKATGTLGSATSVSVPPTSVS